MFYYRFVSIDNGVQIWNKLYKFETHFNHVSVQRVILFKVYPDHLGFLFSISLLVLISVSVCYIPYDHITVVVLRAVKNLEIIKTIVSFHLGRIGYLIVSKFIKGNTIKIAVHTHSNYSSHLCKVVVLTRRVFPLIF